MSKVEAVEGREWGLSHLGGLLREEVKPGWLLGQMAFFNSQAACNNCSQKRVGPLQQLQHSLARQNICRNRLPCAGSDSPSGYTGQGCAFALDLGII